MLFLSSPLSRDSPITVLTGLKTVNEELLYLAQQQVDRDGALREALEECEYLRHALLDSEHRHQLHMEQERMLKVRVT